MSDPLGLFSENKDPLGLFSEDSSHLLSSAELGDRSNEVPQSTYVPKEGWDKPKHPGIGDQLLDTYREALGLKSAAQSAITSAVSFPAAMWAAAGKSLFNGEASPQQMNSLFEKYNKQFSDWLNTNNKKIDTADKYNEALGEFFNQIGIPAAGLHLSAPKPFEEKGLKAKDFDIKLKEAFKSEEPVVPTGPETPDWTLESPTRANIRVQNQNKGGLPTADDFNNRDANVRAVEEEIAAQEARQKFEQEQAQARLDAIESEKNRQFQNAQQLQIDDHPHGDVPAQFGSTLEHGRVDENGIPIRADLSMEAQNLQNPLQKNLWGDELGPALGQLRSLTEAIDRMPQGPERQSALDRLRNAINDAMIESEFRENSPGSINSFDPIVFINGIKRATPVLNKLSEEIPKLASKLPSTNKADVVEFTPKNDPWNPKIPGLDVIEHFDNSTIPKPNLQVVPRSQRGAIDLGPNNNFNSKTKIIENIIKQKLTSPAVTGEQVIQEALASGKDSKGWDRAEAGSSLAAAKRNSPLIQGVSRIIQRASNLADSHIRDFVFPTEKKLRGLSSQEIVQLAKIMKEEELQNKKLSTTQLADLGLSEKQLLAYEAVREMHKDALAKENEARAAQGKKPITEREAYLSSRWKGDFRRPILDKDGELKWYLAADSKRGLEQQTKALLEKFPDLVPGEDHQVHTRAGGPINPAEMYSEMVDVLGRDDPAVARIKEWAEQQAVNEGRGMLAQEKHFKNKLGIRGFVGDRPSNTLLGNFNPKKEAIDLFQQQIAYAKNSYKWSEMQKASQELKKIFSNEELQKTQENNLAYSREYYRNQLGLNTSRVMKELDDVIRQTGVSPNAVNNAIGTTKGLWISQKLVASAGFIASNIIQAGNILPHLADMMVKYGGNPLSAIPVGISSGLLMAAGHIKIAAGRGGFYHYLAALPKEQAEFMVKAMKYAEDNSVIARSVYDESPISTSFSSTSRVAQVAGKTLTAPETLLRSISYMTYVEMLRSSGKFKDPMEIFRLAEERTNMSMVDYRQGERAMLFNQLGTVGNLSNTLMTFPINYYQQWNWAAREAGRGNPLPGAAMFATQAYVAGAMGIPGFSDADKLWNGIKGLLAEHAPLMWDKVKGVDLKSIMLNLGNSALYGGLSEQSGVSVTTRAAAPAGSEMLAAPIAPYVDFAQQIGNVSGMIANPNAQTAAQAALSVAPSGAQGALEVGPLRNQTSVVNPQTGNRVYKSIRDLSGPGQIERTPEEERLRAFGLKSQREVVERDNAFRVSKLESDSRKVMEQLPGRVYNALKVGDKEKAKDLISLYTKLSGKEMSSQQIENEAIREYTTSDQRAKKDSTTIPAMLAIKRLKEIQSESRK